MAAVTSVPHALEVDELLENILIHLDIKKLLQVKRVCSRWNSLISTSPTLQQALYLKPSRPHPTPVANPLFEVLLPEPSKRRRDIDHEAQEEPDDDDFTASIRPETVQVLMEQVPAAGRSMLLLQPPRPYHLVLTLDTLVVSIPNDAEEPVMAAVEKAASIIKLEHDKRDSARAHLEAALRERLHRADRLFTRRLGADQPVEI